MVETLTPDERAALNATVDAWNAFVKLPKRGDWDQIEFMHLIHAAQNIILARPMERELDKEKSNGS